MRVYRPCRGMETAVRIVKESRRMEMEEERAVEKQEEPATIVTTLEIVHEIDGDTVQLTRVDAKTQLE